MIDAFAVLDIPRSPSIGEDLLKEKYLAKAGSLHPDKSPGDEAKSASVQAAHTILKDPALRIRHLLLLESGAEPPKPMAASAGKLFPEVCTAAELSKKALAAFAKSTSPLTRALAAQNLRKAADKVEETRAAITAANLQATENLRLLAARWPSPAEAAALASEFAFLAKCRKELDEASFQLTQALREVLPPNPQAANPSP